MITALKLQRCRTLKSGLISTNFKVLKCFVTVQITALLELIKYIDIFNLVSRQFS